MGLKLLSLMIAFGVFSAHAEEVYPVPTPQRYFGNQQGKEGSCAAEAWTSALEHAFAVRGHTVRLSSYFKHAFNWRDSGGEAIDLQKSPGDAALFAHFQGLIPHYMIPEDGRGLDYYRVGHRPSVTQMIANTSGFPPAAMFGYKTDFYTFEAGYSNSMRDINTLKQWVRERRAVTLSIDSSLLNYFMDSGTGLLSRSYVREELMKMVNSQPESERQTRHAVALVGFDDSLQGGSFIVRNSWNENVYLDSTLGRIDPSNANLARFRAKIDSSRNQPGYFAVPYAYYVDLFSRQLPGKPHPGDGGATLVHINFDLFASVYLQHYSHVEVIRAPFTCVWGQARHKLRRLTQLALMVKKEPSLANKEAYSFYYNDLMDSQRRLKSGRVFSYATLPRSYDGKVDRVKELYSGALNSYYCPGGKVEMPAELVASPEFMSRIREISVDPAGVGSWLRFYKFIIQTLNMIGS